MMTQSETAVATQVYRVYIKATPQAVWDAITKPEWTERYGYGGRTNFPSGVRQGAAFRHLASEEMRKMGAPDVIIDGEVLEADPPHKLVLTWRMVMDEAMAAEGFTRLTHEISERPDGSTRLTIIHELGNAPKLAHVVAGGSEEQGAGGGWAWVLSDLKTLLETGKRIVD